MLELIFGLGLWSWFAVLVFSIAVIAAIETDATGVPILVTVLALILLIASLTGFTVPSFSDTVHWVATHWLTVVYYMAIYLAIGSVWSVAKWWSYCYLANEDYTANKARYAQEWEGKKPGVGSYSGYVDGEYKTAQTLAEFLSMKYDCPPNWKRNKHRITTWIGWWPWSAVWTLIDDPVRRIIRWIYRGLGRVYSAISASAFSDHTELKQ